MHLKKTIKKNQMTLGSIGLILGIILLTLGLFDVVLYDLSPQVITDLNEAVGNWTYWFLVLGGLMILALGWFVYDQNKKRKEFNELIESSSKSKFVKNIARLETLAVELGPDFEERVLEKEKEYNIKR